MEPARLEDLTAAARIREAALHGFAERGVAATSIRQVAKAAGVSPGLVQHHYGSKAKLREAVDEFVTRRASEAFGEVIGGGSPYEIAMELGVRITEFIRSNPSMFTYIGRSLLEGDKAGLDLFNLLATLARAQLDRLAADGLLRSDLDVDWTALHLIIINVGAYLLEPAVSHHLKQPLFSEAGLERFRVATTDLFLRGLYRSPGSDRNPRRRPR